MKAAEERLRQVADPVTGECTLDDTIFPSVDRSKFREAIVREVLISFFKENPKVVMEILNA